MSIESGEIDMSKDVLMIEDDHLTAELLSEELSRLGISIEHQHRAVTLASAREQIRLKRPDLILLDLVLPDEAGEVLVDEANRGDYGLEPLNIVVVSAATELAVSISMIRHGAKSVISKPFRLNQIEEVVRKYLTLSKQYGTESG